MDNNILSSILSLLSGGQNQTPQAQQTPQPEQNPAYYGYPKEAYSFPPGQTSQNNSGGFNIESLLALLAGNKGGLSSILSSLGGKNSPLASVASLLSTNNKKEEESPLPEKEILL